MIILKNTSSATIEDLRNNLQTAIELEHSTIPPYLTANFTLFSLESQENKYISDIIGSVLGEEMLHMSIACNILNAIGGSPAINTPNFIPNYPGHLPGGVDGGLIVGLEKFSKDVIKNVFMEIEEPENPVKVPGGLDAKNVGLTIGQFYNKIVDLMETLSEKEDIFTGDPSLQMVYPSFYPENILFPITDLESAKRGIDIIIDQGEGTDTDPFVAPEDTADGIEEPAHYYRFEEIYEGKKLVRNPETKAFYYSDAPEDKIPFNPDLVANMWPNPRMGDYPKDSLAYQTSREFNFNYTSLLNSLHETFNGKPENMKTALGVMFALRLSALKLLALPDPNHPGYVAGPSFEYVTSR